MTKEKKAVAAKIATPATVIKVTPVTGADAINKLIGSISKRGKALNTDMHTAAISCLIHADKHGDVTLADKLINALPASARKNALKDWFLAFGKFSYDTEGKKFKFKGTAKTKQTEATATPFWLFTPEAEYIPFDATDYLGKVIKKVKAELEKGESVPAELLAGLNDLQIKLVAAKRTDVLAA